MISHNSLTDALLGMFESSPTAICISTSCATESRYLRVNQAYLDLVGKTWQQLQSELVAVNTGAVDLDRIERLRLLDTVGFYQMQEVLIRHSLGRLIPTLISCQRRIIDGQVADIEIITDISERKEFENLLLKAAFTDTLTGIPNRAGFDRELRDRIDARTPGEGLGLAFIDLNHFKAVNDRYGHAVGDALLGVIGLRLSAWTKSEDFVARLGGDEFAVLFGFPSGADVELLPRFKSLAASICTDVSIGDLSISVGAAIGVATATGETTPDKLLHAADNLMYQAKSTLQRVCVHTELSGSSPIDGADVESWSI